MKVPIPDWLLKRVLATLHHVDRRLHSGDASPDTQIELVDECYMLLRDIQDISGISRLMMRSVLEEEREKSYDTF